jgi:hypothetical protein
MTLVRGVHGSYELRGEIAKGGVGSIFATERPELVIKRYRDGARAPSRAHLEPLVSIGREVMIGQRLPIGQQPESSINWPLDLIPGSLGVAAVVLPNLPMALVHPQFNKPRGLEFLIMKRADPPPARTRVALLLRMAEILAYLDRCGLVHGDVSGKNLVWATGQWPIMYLIDCDGMVPREPPPKAGVQTPGWADPRLVDGKIPAHDHRSDWYGLALAMYRGLLLQPGNLDKANGRWKSPSRIPDNLDPRIAGLMRRALTNPLDATDRPGPSEWVAALTAVYLPARTAFDERALQVLDRLAPTSSTPVLASTAPAAAPRRVPGYAHVGPPPPAAAQLRPPVPVRPPPPPPTVAAAREAGSLAQRALHRPVRFHAYSILGLLLPCVGPIAFFMLFATWLQLRRTSPYYPRRRTAIRSTVVYLFLSVVATAAWFVKVSSL